MFIKLLFIYASPFLIVFKIDIYCDPGSHLFCMDGSLRFYWTQSTTLLCSTHLVDAASTVLTCKALHTVRIV
jgi:hypothetical protein